MPDFSFKMHQIQFRHWRTTSLRSPRLSSWIWGWEEKREQGKEGKETGEKGREGRGKDVSWSLGGFDAPGVFIAKTTAIYRHKLHTYCSA